MKTRAFIFFFFKVSLGSLRIAVQCPWKYLITTAYALKFSKAFKTSRWEISIQHMISQASENFNEHFIRKMIDKKYQHFVTFLTQRTMRDPKASLTVFSLFRKSWPSKNRFLFTRFDFFRKAHSMQLPSLLALTETRTTWKRTKARRLHLKNLSKEHG